MIKQIFVVVMILLLQGLPAFAGVTIDPSVKVLITNGNITTATTQTYDTINLTSNAILLNSKTLQLTPSSNANVKINTFDTASDIYNLTLSGTGALDLQQKMILSNQIFNFFRGGVYDFAVTSNSTGWISKTSIPLSPTPQIYTYPLPYTVIPAGGSTGQTNPPGNPGNPGNYNPPIPTPAPTVAINPTSPDIPNINLRAMGKTETGATLLYMTTITGMGMMVLGAASKKVTRSAIVWGLIILIVSLYGLGVIN